jgi:membrane protein
MAETSAPAKVPPHLAGESRAARAWRRFGQLVEHGVGDFFTHGCTQRAAAISFYSLFSIFPLAILSVAVLGLIANDDTARNQVVNFLLDRLPLTDDKGRAFLEHAMRRATREVAGFSVLGIVTLLFAASNVMGSIRQALNAAFRVEEDRPPVQAKLWDLFGVLVFGLLVTASFALTLIDNVVSADSGVVRVVHSLGHVVPLLLAVLVFTGIFRFVPAQRPRLRDIWPGVLLAAVGYELAKRGFTLYLTHFANYGAVYASLGAVVAFLVFTYITAFIALLGAEFAAEWPYVRAGDYDGPPGPPFHRQAVEFVRSLFVRR